MIFAYRAMALVAAVVTAVALAACGGEPRRSPVRELSTPSVSEPPGSAQVTDPARARYVHQVDGVCGRYNPQRERALGEAERAPDLQRAVQAYDANIALAEEQLRGVEAITPPSADRGLITLNVLNRLRERIALRRALRNDLVASDSASAQRDRAQLDALTIALQSFARGYGFRVCGSR